MKFQIEKLIVWPKSTIHAPRVIEFKIGLVNVITGLSRTGKTAIIPIIDYCLGSDSCSIPIGVIRDTASWFGIIVVTESGKVLLARRSPQGTAGSTECFFARGNEIGVPTIIAEPNQTKEGIKQLLNTLASIPYTQRDEEETGWNKSLSFRDLTHLIFQSQEIIANQSVLFYKTHATEHREKLKVWMHFILGAETVEMIVAAREYKEIKSELERREREFQRAKAISAEWLTDIVSKLRVAKEYGLYDGAVVDNLNKDQALGIAKTIIDSKPETIQTTSDTLTNARLELQELERTEYKLSEEIAVIKKRQSNMDALEENLRGFQGGVKRKVDRLGISDWLRQNRKDANRCPFCGGTDHQTANEEINRICVALARYERIGSPSLELPPTFNREKEELRGKLESKTEELRNLHSRYDLLRARDEEVAKYHQRTKDMFTFLGTLQSTLSLVERLSDSGDLPERIMHLRTRLAQLERIVKATNVKSRLDRALQEINTGMLTRLKTLDSDPYYRTVPPKFSEKELGIQVQDSDGVWHWLTEVGSASNWVAFHLALACSLQEYFVRQIYPVSSVPSFTIFDQPSQVYFPQTRHGENRDNDSLYDDKDVGAVKQMFQTIAASVRKDDGAWQAIVLDHAGSDIYGDIDGIVEVEEWRNGKKLIPANWYSESDYED
jgi:hypothetical protein